MEQSLATSASSGVVGAALGQCYVRRSAAVEGKQELRVLLGVTASGKSELALELAERAGAEVVSMDSMLVYRGMDIGTAKPTAVERIRVLHHGLDLAAPSDVFTVQHWLAATEVALADIAARGRRALLVGGTAFYYKALVHGLFDGPDVDPALRASLDALLEPKARDADVHVAMAALAIRLAWFPDKAIYRMIDALGSQLGFERTLAASYLAHNVDRRVTWLLRRALAREGSPDVRDRLRAVLDERS